MKTYKLKDGTEIKETSKGAFAIVFPNKRYMLITTWEGRVLVTAPGHSDFEMGEISAVC
jgi:hypothetical protein